MADNPPDARGPPANGPNAAFNAGSAETRGGGVNVMGSDRGGETQRVSSSQAV